MIKMDKNYTPIDVKKLGRKDSGLNTILLLIVTLTALVLAIMLFILIQRKINSSNTIEPTIIPTPTVMIIEPTIEPVPTEELISPTATATPTIETTITPEASPTSEIIQEP